MSEEMNLYKRCKNIFKFHGVDMGGGGGESAPEVENAIETHGLGWTDTEEKAGFDIQWDGNAEGFEWVRLPGGFFIKVSSDLSTIDTIDDLIGATILGEISEAINVTITDSDLETTDNKVFAIYEGAVIIAFEDGTFEEMNLSKGIWFMKIDSSNFINRFYKEASTEEVVHQIDQKYIPGGSGGSSGSQTVVKIMLTENPEGESADSPYIIESDLTTSEIEEAFKTSNVVAWVYMKNYSTDKWIKMYQLNCMACLNAGEDATIVFSEPFNMGGGTSIFTLSLIDEEWNYSITPIPQPETNE